MMKTYTSLIDGWVAGGRVKVGDLIQLTSEAARCEPVEEAREMVPEILPEQPAAPVSNAPIIPPVKRPRKAKSEARE